MTRAKTAIQVDKEAAEQARLQELINEAVNARLQPEPTLPLARCKACWRFTGGHTGYGRSDQGICVGFGNSSCAVQGLTPDPDAILGKRLHLGGSQVGGSTTFVRGLAFALAAHMSIPVDSFFLEPADGGPSDDDIAHAYDTLPDRPGLQRAKTPKENAATQAVALDTKHRNELNTLKNRLLQLHRTEDETLRSIAETTARIQELALLLGEGQEPVQ